MSEYLYTTPPLDRVVGLRRHIMTTAMSSFGGWGYREIQVPLLHFFDALKPGLDPTQVERSFRFVDRGGNLMVLRPDVTPAIAQTFAFQLRTPKLPLRVSYSHKIVRIERSFSRNELESYQLGVEHIGGSDDMLSDLEVLVVLLEVLSALGLKSYRVHLADHHMAKLLLRATGAPSRLRAQVRQALIARDTDEVLELLNKIGARSEYIDAIVAMASFDGGLRQLEIIGNLFPYDPVLQKRIEYVTKVYRTLEELGYGEHVSVELAELGGASYYTGLGFCVVSDGVGQEIGRGGRYDDLIAQYGSPTPAVGFSLTLGSLEQALNPHFDRTEAEDALEDVLVSLSDPASGLARALKRRRAGAPARLVVGRNTLIIDDEEDA